MPERGPAGERGTGADAGVEGPPGTAAGPGSPHTPGACPQQRASSTSQGSHTGEHESDTGGGKWAVKLSKGISDYLIGRGGIKMQYANQSLFVG